MIRILIEEDCTKCRGCGCLHCQGNGVIRRSITLHELARMFHVETVYRTDNRPPETRIIAR